MIRLPRGATVAALCEAIEGCNGEVIVIEVASDIAAFDRHLILAAIAPLTIELAPARRLCAIDVGEGADPAALTALSEFLLRAEATTGQLVKLCAD